MMVMPGSVFSVVVARLAPSLSEQLSALINAAGHVCTVASLEDLADIIDASIADIVLLNIDAIDASSIELLWSLLARESDGGPFILLQSNLADSANSVLAPTLARINSSAPAEIFACIDSVLNHRSQLQVLTAGARQQAVLAALIAPNTATADTQHSAVGGMTAASALVAFEADGRFVFASTASESIWGFSHQQLMTLRFFDLVHAADSEDEANTLRAIAACAQSSASALEVTTRHIDHQGQPRDLRCTLKWSAARALFYCTAHATIAIDTAPLDDHVQRQPDLILQRLNRALRMLSACNHVMIRATSEQDLLQEICRIVRSIGGYQMAWVGFAIDDSYKTIAPVARAGEQGSILDTFKVSWSADIAEGHGPSGMTIRSGEPTAIANIATSGNFAPWASKFVAAGLHAVVCLPLRDARRTFGAFSLYSSEVRAVADEEMALLQELADNLAFGIEARRVDNERRRLRITVEKIAAAVSATSSHNAGDFFRQMVVNMVDAVDAQAGFIAGFDASQPDVAQTIAVVCNSILQPDFVCPINVSPFAELQREHETMQVANADAVLANLISGGTGQLQAYVGRRLDNAAGKAIGMLFVLFRDPLERIDYILSTLRIIGATVGAEIERQTTDMRLRDQAALLDYATDAIIVRDMNGLVTFWNKGAERLYGWTNTEAYGQQMLSRTQSETYDLQELFDRTTRDGEWRGELQQQRKDGNVLPVEARWTLIRNEHGQPLSIMAIETDISQRKSAENKIEHLAFYDLLTDLPNRSLLRDRLQHSLESNDRNGRMGALLGIDLDNFKALNDSFGHDIGDLLLQLVAVRLSYCLRASDTVARVGGDEFVILLVDLSDSPNEAASRAKMVAEKILTSFEDPFLLGETEAHSTPSIGITLFAAGRDSADELLRRADLAMYQAKAAGRNTMQFFDTDMQAVVAARTVLESEMRTGIKNAQFRLYFQAQVDAAGLPTGAEALVRWQHPQRGIVPPLEFIPLAEETGLIIPLGNWVLEQACETLAQWALDPIYADLSLAVNVSARQLRQIGFVADVLTVLERTGANPRRLKLELTESLLVESVEDTIEKMTQLKAKGVGFSLDDFGVGYSSLSYLKLLPLDQLKIDQSFVRDILTDPNDEAISRTIVALGNSLGLAVIAEGVETAEQKFRLAGLGCFFYQGYFFSRPVPREDFEAFVRNPLGRR